MFESVQGSGFVVPSWENERTVLVVHSSKSRLIQLAGRDELTEVEKEDINDIVKANLEDRCGVKGDREDRSQWAKEQ